MVLVEAAVHDVVPTGRVMALETLVHTRMLLASERLPGDGIGPGDHSLARINGGGCASPFPSMSGLPRKWDDDINTCRELPVFGTRVEWLGV